MKNILIPVILTLFGTGAGIGVAMFLQDEEVPLPLQSDDPCGDAGTQTAHSPAPDSDAPKDYARLNNQFVIPVVQDGRVAALVVMSLSLEVVLGTSASVFAAEPKLRDGFLQNMLDHANRGGFSGNFTQGTTMQILRNDLVMTAQDILGDIVLDVLITDIVRQDS